MKKVILAFTLSLISNFGFSQETAKKRNKSNRNKIY